MFQNLSSLVMRYERHLSAAAMLAGFVVDNIFFGRVDLWQTHAVFIVYTIICFTAIPFLHWLETRSPNPPRWRYALLLLAQFAIGGFLSGLIIFYGRSASFGSSWLFLILIVLVLFGSEYFQRYHARLVFTSVLFFFVLYSYAIFALPVLTGSIGTLTFLGSGALALGLFGLFTVLLRVVARERFYEDVWRIRVGALIVLVLMNLFYFTNILPPLPLSAEAAGVYHSVWRIPDDYLARSEEESWGVKYLRLSPTLHVLPGNTVFAYSSVFAPTALRTEIVHQWERYDEEAKEWVTEAEIGYAISGGRDGGYRGYTEEVMHKEGEWRVKVKTKDGRTIARIPFTVEFVESSAPTQTILLD